MSTPNSIEEMNAFTLIKSEKGITITTIRID
jgi:hypothetical protein